MRGPQFLPVIVFALATAALPARGAAHVRAHARAPVVVELFTAQGCSDCLKAEPVFSALASSKGVIALTWPVDYWDYEGWTDTFAQPEFSARQRAYARRLKVREIYTPEIVVDGERETSALDRPAVDALVASAGHGATGRAADGRPRMTLSRTGERLRVSPGGHPVTGVTRGELWLVRYDPAPRAVKVRSGDNRGKTLVERNVVRQLARLGAYGGGVRSYVLPQPTESGLRTVVLLQAPHGGRILAAAAGD